MSTLGDRADVLSALMATFPTVDLSDPSWGYLEGNGWGIEINIGRADPVFSVMLHVRGGDGALSAVHALADCLGCRALDISSGVFLKADGSSGLPDWRNYRNRVIGEPPTSAP